MAGTRYRSCLHPEGHCLLYRRVISLVLPKESFGENFMPVMKLVVSNLSRDRIYIR